MSPLCKISRYFQSRTEGVGGKLSPPPFKETKKGQNDLFHPVILVMKNKKEAFFEDQQVSTTVQWQESDSHAKSHRWEVQRNRGKFRRSAFKESYRWLLRKSLVYALPVVFSSPKSTHQARQTLNSNLRHFNRSHSHRLALPFTVNFFSSLTVGTARRGETRQVGKGKKERDGSNWIHRFLRN